jgi:calcium/calmodulin-dependent protein kinase I
MGKELFDVLLKVKCFREAEACEIVFEIMSAVKILHDHKIMHRYLIDMMKDLKPENVMYSRNLKTLKLIDFGSAIFY